MASDMSFDENTDHQLSLDDMNEADDTTDNQMQRQLIFFFIFIIHFTGAPH